MRTFSVHVSALVLVYLAIVGAAVLAQGNPEARKLKNPVAV